MLSSCLLFIVIVINTRYERLPVMFVDNWASDLFENPHAEALLEETRKRLAPFYAEGSALRKRTLEVPIPIALLCQVPKQ